MEPIILASGSPRRQEFFRLLGLPFTCIPAEIDETPPAGLSPQKAAEAIALRKVKAVISIYHGVHGETRRNTDEDVNKKHKLRETPWLHSSQINWVFGADTIVVLENEIFGKPENRDAARKMLGCLSGKRHEVITAMALYNGRDKKTDCRSVSCEVAFAPLSTQEIEWYLDTGEWEGAAGAYRLQELGGCLINSIKGSPSAVAGLPLREFYVMLRDNGYRYGA